MLLVPIGGGGLISGVAAAAKGTSRPPRESSGSRSTCRARFKRAYEPESWSR
jgi:threonine dehydratase